MALENKFRMKLYVKDALNKFIPTVTANDNTVFEFEVFDGVERVELLDTYHFIFVTKAIGKDSVMRDAVLNEDGLVEVVLGYSETKYPGTIDCALQIYDENDKRISTMRMQVNVKGDMAIMGGLPAEDSTLIIADEAQLTRAVSAADEVEVSKTTFNTLSERLEHDKIELLTGIGDVDLRLVENTEDINQRGINVKRLGAKGDRVSDDTQAIVNAIAQLNNYPTSSITSFDNMNGGVIELPAGHFLIDSITIKSNITIKGQGEGKTVLIPKFRDITKYMFDVKGTSAVLGRMVNFELRDLSIMGEPNQFNLAYDYTKRTPVSGINLSYTSSCRLKNVVIGNLAGTAINAVEFFDGNLDSVQVLGCGNNDYPGMKIGSDTEDGTNALHIQGSRFEALSWIELSNTVPGGTREIQFVGCKLENSKILYKGVAHVSFSSTHVAFVKDNETFLTVEAVSGVTPYGLNFSACTFTSSNKKPNLYTGVAGFRPRFLGCNFYGFGNIVDNGSIQMVGCEFLNCGPEMFKSTSFSIVTHSTISINDSVSSELYIANLVNNCNFSDNKFLAYSGSKKGIKISGTDNIVNFNEFVGGGVSGIHVDSGTGNVILNNNTTTTGVATNYRAVNHIQNRLAVHFPHQAAANIGEANFDFNTKNFTIHDGSSLLPIAIMRSGITSSRPTSAIRYTGMIYFDTTLGKPVYWNGTTWVDGAGTAL